MKRAAGVILTAPDGSHLFLRRSNKQDHAHEWAFPGGGIEGDEAPEAAARRELEEETGYVPTKEVVFVEHSRRVADGVDFTTFHARVPEKFDPKLNDEHESAEWVARDVALRDMNLHPGAKASLRKFDANETETAELMRDGDLVSPQRVGNLTLHKLRITGTGGSYRPAVKEFVWRDPSLYLNDEFVKRCNGLPVIWEHPEGGAPLDSKSFAERNVGSIILPYIEGDEVWGIGRVNDDEANRILATEQVSTSPCVVFRQQEMGQKYRTEDGTPLLVEGKPWILDHLAICEVGVWDKGGAPSGVANDIKSDSLGVTSTSHEDIAMADKPVDTAAKTDGAAKTEEPVVKADSELVGKKEGEGLDKILAHLDALRADMARCHSRLDAIEIKEKPEHKEEKHEEGKETKETANLKEKAEPTPLAADKSKSDGEMQSGKESEHKALAAEREENHLKANDTAADSAGLRDRLEKIEKHVNMPEDERQKFVAAQLKAERVHQAFGDSAGAPRWLQGETLDQYRRRLVEGFKKHSKGWAKVDLAPFIGEALNTVEDQVYADATTAARTPTDLAEGTLRMTITEDETGRRIRRFYGDPEACWAPFKQPVRRVTGFKTQFIH